MTEKDKNRRARAVLDSMKMVRVPILPTTFESGPVDNTSLMESVEYRFYEIPEEVYLAIRKQAAIDTCDALERKISTTGLSCSATIRASLSGLIHRQRWMIAETGEII